MVTSDKRVRLGGRRARAWSVTSSTVQNLMEASLIPAAAASYDHVSPSVPPRVHLLEMVNGASSCNPTSPLHAVIQFTLFMPSAFIPSLPHIAPLPPIPLTLNLIPKLSSSQYLFFFLSERSIIELKK